MTLELVAHPVLAEHGSFAHMPLGRKAPTRDPRQLQFAKYLDAAAVLPAIPDEVDYGSAVPSWPMYGNDQLGDCTCAAAGHMVQAWSQAAGGMKTMDDADVERMYWETGDPPSGSGTPGGSTDDGRAETGVLDYWRQQGIAAGESWCDRIDAYAAVDPQNADHVKAAVYLFGGSYIGVALPATAQGQQVWDVVPDAGAAGQPGSWGGHAVPIVSFDADGLVVVTWGALLRMTWAFLAEYVDEAYAVVSPDFLGASGASPDGFDLQALETDLSAITQG